MLCRLTVPAFLLLLPALPAQHTILFAVDGNETTLANANGSVEAGLIREDEVGMVTPRAGRYSASVFLSMGAQWSFLGDADADGRLCDASTTGPGDDTDAVMVKRHIGAPIGTITPRDVFFSKEGDAGFAAGFEDGDVFRYDAQGTIEVFVREADLLGAIGQAATGDIDVDAICQAANGDLFLSFDLDEAVNGKTAEDGGLVYIPAAAITYDGQGNVTALAAASAVLVATEQQMDLLVANSGMLTSVGGAPSYTELTALEIDPAGGTWNPPEEPTLTLPNLLFAWSGFSNDGAVLSTAGGGSIAVINSRALASTVATTGVQIGLLPDSTGLGGLMGLALIPAQADELVVENYPVNLITSSTILYTEQQVSGATPGTALAFLVSFGPTATGSSLMAFSIPGFGGQVFELGTLVVTSTGVADTEGYARQALIMPSILVGSGANLCWQVFDAGSFSFGTPAAMQFL